VSWLQWFLALFLLVIGVGISCVKVSSLGVKVSDVIKVSRCQVSLSQSFVVSRCRYALCKDTGMVVGESTLLLDFKTFRQNV
jgi:hypothetical protein